MMLFDLPLEELQTYRPPRPEPADFDAFWAAALAAARATPAAATFTPIDAGLRLIDVDDVSFRGYGGQPIRGWLLRPRGVDGPRPCVVEYIGYGGGRGHPHDWLLFAAAGYAHFVMDTRGQGSVWRRGDTADPEGDGGNPQHPGFMTRGVLSPSTYYYGRLYIDAVQAIAAAREHPAVDAGRVAVCGGSQGGGVALAAAGLVGDLAAALIDVPFLCHFRRATTITDADPYGEIVRFCKIHRDRVATVFATLDYFDGINFAARGRAPALFSVGLMDDVCPPSTVFAAYNHYAGPKEMRVWPFNRHEGGEGYQTAERLRFLRELW
ncbi:MAG TPA: alpha/beta fold hydrolase [Promineifilum sp.]|nr:alpha/beta fold hydrolase [Promineifilum sp.]